MTAHLTKRMAAYLKRHPNTRLQTEPFSEAAQEAEYRASHRRLTRQEKEEGLADRGIDTLEEARGER